MSSSASYAHRIVVSDLGDGIKEVELNRPDKMNALDGDMFKAICLVAKELKQDKKLRAVILSGRGKAFCTGLDIKSLNFESRKLLDRPAGTELTNTAQDVAYLWRMLDVPVIAAVHGMCFGGGLQIALGADFRITTSDCKFSIMEAKWGLIPDMSISVTLRELLPIDVAKELTMTARIINGDEAKGYGLVTKVVENPKESAMNLAKEILSRSPDSVAATKQLYQRTWLAPEKDALELETKLQKKLLFSMNQISAVGNSSGVTLPFKSRQDLGDD